MDTHQLLLKLQHQVDDLYLRLVLHPALQILLGQALWVDPCPQTFPMPHSVPGPVPCYALTASQMASRCQASSFWAISLCRCRNQPSKWGDLKKRLGDGGGSWEQIPLGKAAFPCPTPHHPPVETPPVAPEDAAELGPCLLQAAQKVVLAEGPDLWGHLGRRVRGEWVRGDRRAVPHRCPSMAHLPGQDTLLQGHEAGHVVLLGRRARESARGSPHTPCPAAP